MTAATLLYPPPAWNGLVAVPFGGGVTGNTTGSGPVIEGSIPSPRATASLACPTNNRGSEEWDTDLLTLVPSSSGLGYRPLKAGTPVQIRSGLLK